MVNLPDAPGCAQVILSGTNQTTKFQNIFHFQWTGTAPTPASLAALITSLAAAWNTNFGPLCNTGVALTHGKAADLSSRTSNIAELDVTGAGTRAGSAMTTQVACVVSWAIARRYKGGHPRTYLPAGVLADVTQGHLWTTGFVNSAGAAADAFLAAANAISNGGTTYKLACVSYHDQKVLRPLGLPFLINDGSVHTRVDTQRGRLGREVI